MEPLRISGQFVLVRYFMSELLLGIEQLIEVGSINLNTASPTKGMEYLANGHVDFFLCYHHPNLPVVIDPQRFPSFRIGAEISYPVSKPDENGKPLFALPVTREHPLPYIGFSPEAPVGWQRQSRMHAKGMEAHLEPLHESTMSEVVREFIREGRGTGWLLTCPHEVIQITRFRSS
jgi:LysR family transcriptional regulator, hypochlorite-specific transcription factor HypT